MSNFKREVRYTVIKHNQLTDAQIGFLKNCIHGEGIPTVKAVVVESDWPEYEPVWKMIEDRVSGAPVEGGKAEYDAMAKAMTKDKTVTMPRELIEEVVAQLDDFITDGILDRLKSALAAPVVERQEPMAWLLCNGDESPIDSTIHWDVAKHWPELAEPLYASPPAPVAVASREESICWLKRIDGIGQNRAELIYSMGFRRHTEVPQS